MPIPKALASYFLFASYFHFAANSHFALYILFATYFHLYRPLTKRCSLV